MNYYKKYLKYKSKYLQLKGGSDFDGQDAVIQACRDSDLPWLKSLSKTKFTNGGTIAHYLASKGDAHCLTALHNAGADLGVVGNGNVTPAHLAARNGHAECLEVLGNAGVNLRVATLGGWGTPAHFAAIYGNAECLTVLGNFGVGLGVAHGKDHDTPAHMAATKGHVKCLEVLGTSNPNLLYAKNGMEATPAHMAALHDTPAHAECLTVMHEFGVNMYVSDNERHTPAYSATINGNARCLEVIIDSVSQTHGDVVARNMLICRDKNDNTPVLNAVRGNHVNCLEVMVELGVTDIPILNGRTPAHYAAQFGHLDCLKVMFRGGVSIFEPDRDGLTPLNVAGNSECADYLREMEDLSDL